MNGNEAAGYAPQVDILPLPNVYPTMWGSATLGERSGGIMYGASLSNSAQTPDAAAPAAAPAGLPGGALTGGLTLVVLLVILMWAGHRLEGDKLANIKGTAYNVFTIGLTAMLFFVIAKVLTSRFRIPGVSSFVQAA